MCDYSLMVFPNRLARDGEELVTHRFPNGSIGLASPADLQPTPISGPGGRRSFWTALKDFFKPEPVCSAPAVCIPPGARLQLHAIPADFQDEYGLDAEEEVVFEELSASVNTYRDAVRFRNGRQVRLQELPENQAVTVLRLAGRDSETADIFGDAELSPREI